MGNRVFLLFREDKWGSLGWARSPIAKVDLGSLEGFDYQNALVCLKSSEALNEIDDFFVDYKKSILVKLMGCAGLSYRDLLFNILLKSFNKDTLYSGGKIEIISGDGYDVVLSAECEEVK